jgi:hypothetical protein
MQSGSGPRLLPGADRRPRYPEDCIPVTGGLYEFIRMCFGLTGAPATFMRLMDKVFGDLNFRDVLIYLDDILIFGSTIEETLERLEEA